MTDETENQSTRVDPNAASEYQRLQAAQRRRKRADPFFHLVTKQSDRLSRPHVLRLALQQVAHVGTGFGYPEQPGLEIDHLVELLRAHFLTARQVPNQPGIEVTGPRAHGHPGAGG